MMSEFQALDWATTAMFDWLSERDPRGDSSDPMVVEFREALRVVEDLRDRCPLTRV